MNTCGAIRFDPKVIISSWHDVLRSMCRKSISLVLLTMCSPVFAQGNSIESIDVSKQDSSVLVKIKLMSVITEAPHANFTINPNRLVLDFPHTFNASALLPKDFSFGEVRGLVTEQAGDASRVTIELESSSSPAIRMEGDSVIIVTSDATLRALHLILSEQPPEPFEIHVKDIDPRSLLYLAAEHGNLGVVAGDELTPATLDVNESSIEGNQLIVWIVNEQHLAMRTMNDIIMIGSACRLAQNPAMPTQKGDQDSVSLRFANASLQMVWRDVFRDLTPFEFTDIGESKRVTIRMEKKTVRDQVMAIATVEGWTPLPSTTSGILFVRNEAVKKCKPRRKIRNTSPAVAEVDKSTVMSRACPGLALTGSFCSALERYELEELKVVGYIQPHGMHLRAAIIEAASREVFEVLEGDDIGRNFGKVKHITDTGVNIVERFLDSDGKWKDRNLTLNFPP